MNLEMILKVLQFVAYIVLGGLAIWFKTSEKAQKKAKEIQETLAELGANAVILIKQAEEDYQDVTNAGGDKFNQVVDQLYSLVPNGLNKIIDREMIEDIVQSTFDEIEEYVKLQLDKATEKIEVKE